jgi:Xaa-Pro dipeptidase
MYAARLNTLRRIAADAGLDAILLLPGRNLVYVTGQQFHLMERPTVGIFPREGDPVILLPALEVAKFAAPPYPLQIFTYTDTEGPEAAYAAGLAAAGLAGKRAGVEGLVMRFAEMQLLQRHAPGIVFEDATGPLAALRLCKAADEVASMRRAIQVSEEALRQTIAAVRPGQTEQQIANALLIAMLQGRRGNLPFEPIVLGGPRSALPHGVPEARPVLEGELLPCSTTAPAWAATIPTSPAPSSSGNFAMRGCRTPMPPSWPPTPPGARPPGRACPPRKSTAPPAPRSSRPDSGSTSPTAPGTAWAWTSTNRPTSARAIPSGGGGQRLHGRAGHLPAGRGRRPHRGRRPDHARRSRVALDLPRELQSIGG